MCPLPPEINTNPRPQQIVASVRTAYNTGITHSLKWREQQLRQLYKLLDENQEDICEANWRDMKKAPGETWLIDVLPIKNEIAHALEYLEEWNRPEVVGPGPLAPFARAEIHRKPLGVALIIGIWNYPWCLIVGPLLAAIAGGNAVVLKPPEMVPNCAAVFTSLVHKYLDTRVIQVVNGAIPETTELLKERFDHITYTGNNTVAKIVHKAANKHLTPVLLELGGKSPVIIDENVDITNVANRLMWAKSLNSGQTCIAPDYILIPSKLVDPFVEACGKALKRFYGERTRDSPLFPRLISDRHFERMVDLLDKQVKVPGSKIAFGGEKDREDRFVEPTLITGVGKNPETNPIMNEEIFGPLLPIVEVNSIDESIAYINSGEKPLALYVFTKDKKVARKVLRETDSGNAVVNDLFSNMGAPDLPFGGVGNSGMGKYHGHHGFLEYTHARSTLIAPHGMEFVSAQRYLPSALTNRMWLATLAVESKVKSPLVITILSTLRRIVGKQGLLRLVVAIVIGFVAGWFGARR
ncbi:aldehyde dehydrogenase 3 A2 [Fimicolochytrium jonesii]|uniref:aldehyde dehydrogenase 3 A2 n=1 Tax=Fimicolochytrium jonesii TaxID=1396493 RepID=UPI0022FF348C|nr:aldehyde dehydrogenase 3 A2 [Fimicolochytrium jonesii]KAI8827130.1 aldehyde dehydrogenase 3 A2 [Fimicolochytrium jonesii]